MGEWATKQIKDVIAKMETVDPRKSPNESFFMLMCPVFQIKLWK